MTEKNGTSLHTEGSVQVTPEISEANLATSKGTINDDAHLVLTRPSGSELAAADHHDVTQVRNLKKEMGFGDFCFGRRWIRLPWYRAIKFKGEEWEREEHINSRLGQIETIEPFRFSDLPVEIRYRILRMLVEPLFESALDTYLRRLESNNETDNQPVHRYQLQLFIFKALEIAEKDRRQLLFAGDYQNYLDFLQKESGGYGRSNRAGWQMHRSMYDYEKQRYDLDCTVHPARLNDIEYDVTQEQQQSSMKNRAEFAKHDQLRILSNVSCGMRQELGMVFWRNIELTTTINELASGSVSAFLRDRPKVHAQIKSLYVSIDFVRCPDDAIKSLMHLESACRYLGQVLKLEKLELVFALRFHGADIIASGKKEYANLKSFSFLHAKTVMIEMEAPNPNTYNDIITWSNERSDAFREKYSAKLKELLGGNNAFGDVCR